MCTENSHNITFLLSPYIKPCTYLPSSQTYTITPFSHLYKLICSSHGHEPHLLCSLLLLPHCRPLPSHTHIRNIYPQHSIVFHLILDNLIKLWKQLNCSQYNTVAECKYFRNEERYKKAKLADGDQVSTYKQERDNY